MRWKCDSAASALWISSTCVFISLRASSVRFFKRKHTWLHFITIILSKRPHQMRIAFNLISNWHDDVLLVSAVKHVKHIFCMSVIGVDRTAALRLLNKSIYFSLIVVCSWEVREFSLWCLTDPKITLLCICLSDFSGNEKAPVLVHLQPTEIFPHF